MIGLAPREKRYHMAALINDAGEVSALCSASPRPIDLRRASWTNRAEAVTCPRCLRMMSEREAERILGRLS